MCYNGEIREITILIGGKIMRVLFEEGVVREVCSAEVKPMDVEFVKQLYTYGMADFSDQPVEQR